MSDPQEVTGIKYKPINSVPINVSIPNRRDPYTGKRDKSLYGRLAKYIKDRGISEQDAIRFFITQQLNKLGY